MKNIATLKDTLYNASLDVTKADYDPDNLNKAQIYGRGVVVGAIGTIMALGNIQFQRALKVLKPLLPSDFDIRCLPECWVEDYLKLP